MNDKQKVIEKLKGRITSVEGAINLGDIEENE